MEGGVDTVFSLKVYGPLGVLAILGVIATVWLYLDNRKLHKEYGKQLKDEREACEKERKDHAEAMRVLEERYITKAETNMDKYHALADSMNRVLESAMRRYPRDSGGPHGRSKDG